MSWNEPLVDLSHTCSCSYREIELPLHDNGLEPVEFLRSMGVSLLPLSEMMAADGGSPKVPGPQGVLLLFVDHFSE